MPNACTCSFPFYLLKMFYDMDICQFYLPIKRLNLFLCHGCMIYGDGCMIYGAGCMIYTMCTSSLLNLIGKYLLHQIKSNTLNLVFVYTCTCKLIKALNDHSYQRTCFRKYELMLLFCNFQPINNMLANVKHGVCQFWFVLAIL